MAGGYKLFSTGEVLTAANVNNYLMNQTVMVFASAAARTTALSGVLAEGMISYRSDAKVLEIYNGTSWITESAFVSPLTTKGDVHTYSTTDARLGVGTTNQTLIVDSTQTTGLKWAASPQSTLSAKGSLVSASAANTLAELTVGSDGQTLVADSSTSTGLRYQVPVNANPVINSAMQVWQRGTSISAPASSYTYTADRWRLSTQANQASTVSSQVTNDTTNLPFIQYCARVQRNSGQTGATQMSFIQGMETINSIPYAGKTVTLSFYARAGANYSPTSNAFNFMVYTGTGTDQFPTSYTGGATAANASVTLTTTWVRYTVTGTIATTATEIGLYAYWTPTGTAGANDYVEITGVQLEVGSVATPFKTYAGTIQGELAACQRYYYRAGGSSLYEPLSGYSAAYTTAIIDPIVVPAPVTMRIAPTSLDTSTIQLTDGVTSYTTGTWALSPYGSKNYLAAKYTHGSAALTIYRPYLVCANNSTNAYIGFSAEL